MSFWLKQNRIKQNETVNSDARIMLLRIDGYWYSLVYCRSPVTKYLIVSLGIIFNAENMQWPVHIWIYFRQTLVCLFLFTAGILFLHTFQLREDRIGLVLTNSFLQSSTFVPTLQSWADQLKSNPTDLELWKNTWPQLCSVSLCLSEAQACQLCESQLPGQQHEPKNHAENQKLTYSPLPISKFSWISVQPAQEASNLHIQQTSPKLAKWLEYLLANSCVLVENIQIIIFCCLLESWTATVRGKVRAWLFLPALWTSFWERGQWDTPPCQVKAPVTGKGVSQPMSVDAQAVCVCSVLAAKRQKSRAEPV